jgi:hypothetical protein
VRNEANFGEPAGRRNTQHSTILSFHHPGPRPIGQNKANFGESEHAWRPNCAKQSQTWAGWDIWGTPCQGGGNRAKRTQFGPGQASRAMAGANRAKRTQFPASQGLGTPDCAKRTQFGWSAGGPEGQMRKTNPIPARPGGTRPGGRGTNVRNKPNFPAVPRGARPQRRGTRGKRAKRTQFPVAEIPALPIFPTIPLFYYSSIPIRCRWCETKPLW